MSVFGAKRELSRRDYLDQAHEARTRGKTKKAIELYERVLSEYPGDYETRARAAPLLVQASRVDDAADFYLAAIGGYREAGFSAKALGLAVQAVQKVPQRVDGWTLAADLYLEAKRKKDALDTLHQARRQFDAPKDAARAVVVLFRLAKLAPGFAVLFDLATSLARAGRRRDALVVLRDLERNTTQAELRTVRYAILRYSPSFRTLFRYLRAFVNAR